MATIAGLSRVPKPLVLSLSTTMLPEKTNSWSSAGIATGSSRQCTRSPLTAWPQEMLPQVVPDGLYW